MALNEVLQKDRKSIYIWFCWVRYLLSGAISMLLTEKANAGILIFQWSNVLIWVTKTVDLAIKEVEILKHWQHFKVYWMLLEKYLDKENMELLKQKVESSTRI